MSPYEINNRNMNTESNNNLNPNPKINRLVKHMLKRDDLFRQKYYT